jgi:hypothetical protein
LEAHFCIFFAAYVPHTPLLLNHNIWSLPHPFLLLLLKFLRR